MIVEIVVFTIISKLLFPTVFAVDPCRFEDPAKGVIDLTALGRTDGNPAYRDKIPLIESNYVYSYNPCKPFSEESFCKDVAACQVVAHDRHTTALGSQQSAIWNSGTETGLNPSITYSESGRTVVVELECSTIGEEDFVVVGENPMNFYTFVLKHKCACWNGCSSISSTTTTTTTTVTATTTTASPITHACRFEYPGKGVIDFSFIGRTDEKAAYTDEPTRTTSGFKYSYNPCRSFSQGNDCIGVALCQISKNGQEMYALGTQESASWNPESGINNLPSINYVYENKKATVLLQCSPDGNNEFQAFGEDPINTFRFQFTHKCACWNACSSKKSFSPYLHFRCALNNN